MKFLIAMILSILYANSSVAQYSIDNNLFDKVELLLSKKEKEQAKLELKIALSVPRDSTNDVSYKWHYATGLFLYIQGDYERSIQELLIALKELDSLQCWDCDNYLRSAFYLSDSFFLNGQEEECKEVINHALGRCADIYDNCIYSIKMYQLLLALNDDLCEDSPIKEQLHNEIQKIAVYSKRKNSKEHKDAFDLFYYYKKDNPFLNKDDSIIVDLGKGMELYLIGEDLESIRLYERALKKMPENDITLKGYYESLLIMYSRTGREKSIDSLLQVYYSYCNRLRLKYDEYSDNMLIGTLLAENGFFEKALIFCNRCDSILNINRVGTDWEKKKKLVLDRLLYCYRKLKNNERLLFWCKEYVNYIDASNYEEYCTVLFFQSKALSDTKEYKGAILILDRLQSFIISNHKEKTEEYVRVSHLLGWCHVNLNHNNKCIEQSQIALKIYKEIKMDDKYVISSLYNNIGKAYVQNRKYKEALPYLELSAESQLNNLGKVSENTQSYIDECKKH